MLRSRSRRTRRPPVMPPGLGRALLVAILLLGLAPLVGARAAGGTTWTVCPNFCDFTSIQTAVGVANPGDTIRIVTSVPHTENSILIDKSIYIEGSGMHLTTVQGAPAPGGTGNPVFEIVAGDPVTFSDLTVRYGGQSGGPSAGGGILNENGTVHLERIRVQDNQGAEAGGIYNNATMIIHDSRIENNAATLDGGGISNYGTLEIHHSDVVNNSSGGAGGVGSFGGLLTIQDSRISGNDSASSGGGIFARASSAEISRTSIHDNSATLAGGGVYADSQSSWVNVTISGNETPGSGGGMYISDSGDVTLANVTVSDNTADSDDNSGGIGGGIFVDPSGALHMKNSIIEGNHDLSNFFLARAPDCHGLVISNGYILIGDLGQAVSGTHCTVGGSSIGNQIGVTAELGPLQDNGGPTPTHALLPASPAINTGHPTVCTDYDIVPITVDQRGGIRFDRCDMGSFEFNALFAQIYLPIIRKP